VYLPEINVVLQKPYGDFKVQIRSSFGNSKENIEKLRTANAVSGLEQGPSEYFSCTSQFEPVFCEPLRSGGQNLLSSMYETESIYMCGAECICRRLQLQTVQLVNVFHIVKIKVMM
jgi:hypothetical protein